MAKNIINPMIEYLEIDENIYVENDVVKYRLNENINHENYISWDELWEGVHDAMSKIKQYDEKHNNNTM